MNILRQTLVIGVILPLSAALSSAAQTATTPPAAETNAPKPKLGSTIFQWKDVVIKPGGTKAARSIARQPTATLEVFESHVTSLAAGAASHLPHQHGQEEFIIVHEGELEVHINGETKVASTGSLLFYASNDFHGVRNLGKVPATYIVVNYRTSLTAKVPKERAADSAPAGSLRSAVFEWKDLKVTPTKTGEKRSICNAPTVTLLKLEAHVSSLKPGMAAHAAHRHPDEEVVIVKEGFVEATVNGKSERVGPGGVILFASNDEHGLRNAGDTTATYYVVRMTTPETPKK